MNEETLIQFILQTYTPKYGSEGEKTHMTGTYNNYNVQELQFILDVRILFREHKITVILKT